MDSLSNSGFWKASYRAGAGSWEKCSLVTFHHILCAIGTPQIKKRHKLILKHFNLTQCFSSCSPGGDHIDPKASKKWGKQYWRKRCFYKVTGVAVWSKSGHVWFFFGWRAVVFSKVGWFYGFGVCFFLFMKYHILLFIFARCYCCVVLCQVWGYAIQMLPGSCRSSWLPVVGGRKLHKLSGFYWLKRLWLLCLLAFFCHAKEFPLQNLFLVQDCSGLKYFLYGVWSLCEPQRQANVISQIVIFCKFS